MKGLNTLLQDKKLSRWSYRVNIFLSAAEQYHDKRLVEPLIKILNIRQSPYDYTHDDVIKLLVKYDDPRVPQLVLRELAIENPYTTGEVSIVAMTELTRLLGAKNADFLIANYQKTKNLDLKCHILHVLAQLSYDNDVYAYPRKVS